jgi:xylulokinase
MIHRYIVTVDVGTSSTKTVLWDDAGKLVASASHPYPLNRPYPLWAEIDGLTWWEAVCTTIQQVMASSGADPRQVAGIGVDGVGWTLLPVDQRGAPLSPAMIWLDRRAEEEANWLRSLPEANSLVNLCANPLDSAYITPKLIWLRNHRPDIFEATSSFLTASGFIVACFTGQFTCDYTQAYGYHFFDMARQCWNAEAAARVGISLNQLPRLCLCTEIIGTVTPQAAAMTGLRAGIPVIAGCLDAASGALGAGVTRLGQTNEQGGQAGGVAVSLDHVVVEPRLIFSPHVLPNQYLLQAGTVGGGSLGWFRDMFNLNRDIQNELGVFESFSLQAEQTPPGSHGLLFIPYMAGERTPLWNSNARGVFFGLSYNTTRGDMLRAIMEGCAFAVYDNLQLAEGQGVAIKEYLGSGGATQSAVWCQIKADIYNKPFVVARREDGGEGGHSLGLYALTAYAAGLCEAVGTCVERLLPNRQVFEPSAERHALYEDLFGIYHHVSRQLLQDFDRLAAVSQEYGLIMPVST